MIANVDTAKNMGIKTANMVGKGIIKSMSYVLDNTAEGLSFLSALVKGDKKIKVYVEEAENVSVREVEV